MEIIEIIVSIIFTILIGAITTGFILQMYQELKFRKEIHDKEMEEINLKILRVQQAITNDNKVSQETLKEIRDCKIVI